eukprot:c11071_g1_i1.p1 GENE.c11071_g1_i1~~c11071_g1_i1.p1  ORF type:complete len:387 (-),score=26.51 c11071_g1_i1:27-1187(-)
MSRYNQPVIVDDVELKAVNEGNTTVIINDNNFDNGNYYEKETFIATAPPAVSAPPSYQPQTTLPQYSESVFPRGDTFVARARSSEYHVHTEKWMSDSWKIYKKNCGAFCSGVFFFVVVTFIFLVIFGSTMKAIDGDHENTNANAMMISGFNSPSAFAWSHGVSLFSQLDTMKIRKNIESDVVEEEKEDDHDNDHKDKNKDKNKEGKGEDEKEGDDDKHKASGGAVAFAVISLFVFYFFFVAPMTEGFTLATFQALRGRAIVFNDFFSGYSVLGAIFTKHTFLFVSGFIPFIGFFLRFYLAFALIFFVSLVFNHPELTRGEAMKLSMHVVNKSLCGWLFFGLFILVINLIGLFAFGLGLIITIPLTHIVVAVAYADIFGLEGYISPE